MPGILLSFLIVMSACTSSQPANTVGTLDTVADTNKTLIVYLTRTGNTKAIAEIIQKHIGGELIAIELETPYPKNYQETVQQVSKENETGYLPPLKTKIENIEKYDVVFVGFPTWGMQMPPPMKSFLHQYNLSGKTVIPFNTNAGYGVGNSFETVKELCPNSKVLEGFEMKAGAERDGQFLVIKDTKAKEAEKAVKTWLEKLNLFKKAP